MQIVADLHLHSKFSRAVSQQMTLQNMAKVAQQKGIHLLSASDFTHPVWFKEIQDQLVEDGEGVYKIKDQSSNIIDESQQKMMTRFILSTEIACISKHKDKLRRIHNLIFVPNMETVEKINAAFIKRGVNLHSDGRPIMGLTSKNVLELLLEIDERCFLIPCHVWTPHFGLFGSASGYDSIVEAFDELAPYIYGIETGLSSDPDMNWSIPELKNRSIISTSDAHSLPKMGREATVFELEEVTFGNVKKAIMRPIRKVSKVSQVSNVSKALNSVYIKTFDTSDTSRILYTIEFYPEEGKYHFSGHRACKVSYGPKEIKEKGTACPVCKRKMTEGVIVRVQQLADEALVKRIMVEKNASQVAWFTDRMHEQPPYVKLVPLLEIIAESMESTVASQKVHKMFSMLISKVGTEMDILLKAAVADIERVGGERLAEGIEKVRSGDIVIDPGYDGEYGHVKIWKDPYSKGKQQTTKNQLSLEF